MSTPPTQSARPAGAHLSRDVAAARLPARWRRALSASRCRCSATPSSPPATCSTCCARPRLLFLMASGLTLVILTAGLDLSVGANIGLSACLAATVIKIDRLALARRRWSASAAAR